MSRVHDGSDEDLEVGERKRSVAGVGAVLNSLVHSVQQMGVKRTALTLAKVNQVDGFDCPGCAWPDPDPKDRSPAEFCENGSKAVAEEATTKRVTAGFFATHSIQDLQTRSDHWLGQHGRISQPVIKRSGQDFYQPISWDDAFDEIASRLAGLEEANQAVFYTSGRTSNEAAFCYQLLARRLGTNNLPDCSNMCHESSGAALSGTIGIGKGTVSLHDVENSSLLLIQGQNPGTNHPRMLTALEKAKKRGATIVSINPLPEAGLAKFRNPQTLRGLVGVGTQLADHFCQIRLGGDQAFHQGVAKVLLDMAAAGRQVLDSEFITSSTSGFDDYADHIRATSWQDIEHATGLSCDEITRIAELIAEAPSMITCWAMGLTQHKNSVATIREIVNVHLLRGMIGRPGAGVCPVRGHSNVQGDRTMGIFEQPARSLLDALDAEFDFTSPREHGHDTVDSIRAMRDDSVRFFMSMGGNFVRATPDTRVCEAALQRVDFGVHVSTKLNGSHAWVGDTAIILPPLGRTERDLTSGHEQFVSVEDSMGMVHSSRGRLGPAGDLRSEVEIVTQIGQRLFPELPWVRFRTNYDHVRDVIERVINGFGDFNNRVRQPGGFALPNPPRDSRTFHTPDQKAHFTVNPLDVLDCPPGRLILQTVRSHDQYNTTIYGMNDRNRGIKDGRRVVFVHPDDLAELGHSDGDVVDLVSEWHAAGGVEARRAAGFRLVAFDTARSCAAAYFPETNALVPLDSTADVSNTPTSKSILIRLEPAHGTQPVR